MVGPPKRGISLPPSGCGLLTARHYRCVRGGTVRTVKTQTRRKWDVVWLGLGAGIIGIAALIGVAAGDTERIGNYYTHAVLDTGGSAQVIEVIDYDFGINSRRGIYRDIPGLDPGAEVLVTSPTAPDDVVLTPTFEGLNVRIGNPDVTVTNRHRYRIEYRLDTLVQGQEVAWDVLGTRFDVGVDNLEGHLGAPNVFNAPTCDRGKAGDEGGCTVTQPEPGHLVVEAEGFDAGEGLTIYATLGAPLEAAPTLPLLPTGPAQDPGSGLVPPALLAAGVAVVTAFGMSKRVRFKGKELVYEGGAADAAFGPRDGEALGVRSVDHSELADLATIEFAAPKGLSASAGGIIYAESVKAEHQIAWLIECAIRDEVVLEEPDQSGSKKKSTKMVLRRGSATPHPAAAGPLAKIFGGREEVELGKYDKEFASAWSDLAKTLDAWREGSQLWDPRGERSLTRHRVWGTIAALAGLAITVLGGVLAARSGPVWWALVGAGALVASAGFAAAVRSWELRVRSPQGSAQWLQVESFRRFIANSEARHAESAANMGLLRQYTAWAVALGELDHWEEAVEEAAALPNSAVSVSSSDFAFVAMAPAISSATASTFTAPSSSGGGGGGAGGGGGGGGGGSW